MHNLLPFTFYPLPQNGYVLSLFLCLFKQGTPNDEANVGNIWQFSLKQWCCGTEFKEMTP
ncbi:hypothetical protein OC25_09315 [Pedobacter kyungheensis]|uniref:Uncharacterized protein n=1 Tax=Pedobacter kyungheensis TaxID=1069985 RepID=A0A0C1FS38_9SPHI|nr:hypothetical protein OC25_09315 [Pedobacter kyungheensis]